MRVTTVLEGLLGLCPAVVVRSWELIERSPDAGRPRLVVSVRTKAGRRGLCGRCGEVSPWFDRGDGERSWRHLDVGYATCELVADAPRVSCRTHGPTAAEVPWARHDSAFGRAFEDLVVHDAVVANKQAAAERYAISWRASQQRLRAGGHRGAGAGRPRMGWLPWPSTRSSTRRASAT